MNHNQNLILFFWFSFSIQLQLQYITIDCCWLLTGLGGWWAIPTGSLTPSLSMSQTLPLKTHCKRHDLKQLFQIMSVCCWNMCFYHASRHDRPRADGPEWPLWQTSSCHCHFATIWWSRFSLHWQQKTKTAMQTNLGWALMQMPVPPAQKFILEFRIAICCRRVISHVKFETNWLTDWIWIWSTSGLLRSSNQMQLHIWPSKAPEEPGCLSGIAPSFSCLCALELPDTVLVLFVTVLSITPLLRANDAATPLKLYLLMECNRPIRNLLFYVLRYEFGSQISD